MTPASEVVVLLDRLEQDGVGAWVDGGWGVDALLGEQTREHHDLDLVVELRDVSAVVSVLRERGYVETPTPFSTDVHRVWSATSGVVDLHVVRLAASGDGHFGPDSVYPAAGLRGRGVIGGRQVRCVTAEVQVEFHLGYDHDDGDVHDVLALCRRFHLPVPEQYAH